MFILQKQYLIMPMFAAFFLMMSLSDVTATPIKNIGFQDFYSHVGVYTSFDLSKVELGKSVSGLVKDDQLLKKAGGPEGVKIGDPVIFYHLGNGEFRLIFPKLLSKKCLDIQLK